MSQAVFQPGQMIFREGDTTQEAYRILKGRVEISIAGEGKAVILAQLGEGDIFGEMAMVDERPRSASAQALEVTECEVLTAENFNEAVLQRPEILTDGERSVANGDALEGSSGAESVCACGFHLCGSCSTSRCPFDEVNCTSLT